MSASVYVEAPDWLMSQEWPVGSREARAKLAWELRLAGRTGMEIAQLLGVKRSTAFEFLSDPDGSKAAARKMKRFALCAGCGIKVTNGGSEPPKRCLTCAREQSRTDIARRLRVGSYASRMKWSDEDIFAAIASIVVDGRASCTDYLQAYGTAPKGSMPSMPLIVTRFDRWAIAVEAAGFITKSGRSGAYSTRLTQEMALLAVEECAAEVGHPPSYSEYEVWAKRTGAPSGCLVRNRFGSWGDAIRACIAQTSQVAA